MTLAISGPTPENVTTGLTPTSTGCESSLATTVCTFSYLLAPGSYTATITTYDEAPVGGSIPAGAKVLSTAQGVAFTITAGQTNDVGLTLSGVPTAIAIVPFSGFTAGTLGQTIDLIGLGAHKFMVQALDADGNTIFGAGSPTFSVASSGSLGVTLGQPSTAAPNAFSVSPPPAYSSATATVTVTASYAGQATDGCAQSGAVCTASFAVDMKELIATLQSSSFDLYEAGQTAALASITFTTGTAPVSGQSAFTFDSAGDLVIATCQVGCAYGYGGTPDAVRIYAPPYDAAPITITKGIYHVESLALDSGGNLWVGSCYTCEVGGADTITKYTPPFSSSSVPALTISTNVSVPIALAFDPSGNLWVANCQTCVGAGTTDTVTEYSNAGAQLPPTLTGLSQPYGLALDSSSDVFVANRNGSNVKEFSPPSYSSTSPTTLSTVGGTALSQPQFLYQSGSDLWIADNNAGTNGEVFECGLPITGGNDCTGPNVKITGSINQPVAFAFDGQSNLYVLNNGGSANLVEYASPYTALTGQTSTGGYGTRALEVLP